MLCDELGYFEGYASVYGVKDSHGDVVVQGAFDDSLNEWQMQGQWPKLLWQHEPEHVIGYFIDMIADDTGLYVKGQLILEVAKAREVYALLKAGAVDELSIGYHVVESVEHNGTVYLQKIAIAEVSVVSFAANPAAKISYVKSRGGSSDCHNEHDPVARYSTRPQEWTEFCDFLQASS